MKPLIVIFIFIPWIAISQSNNQIDSIRKLILRSKSDSLKSVEYLEIANRHLQKDSVYKNLNLALTHARTAKTPRYISNSRVNLSNWYYNNRSKEAAIKEHLDAIDELKKYNFLSGIANHYIRLSSIYRKINTDTASIYLTKGLNIAKASKDNKVIVIGLLALGTNAFFQNDFEKSLEHYIEADKICTTDKLLNESLIHASALENMGYIMQKIKKQDKALVYFKKSLNILKKNNNQKGIINIQSQIAIEYIDKKDYTYAISLLNKTIDYNNTLAQKFPSIISAYLNRAICYEKTNVPEKAENDYLTAIELSKQLQIQPSLRTSLFNTANFYLNQKQYNKAEPYYLDVEKICIDEKNYGLLEKIYKGLAAVKVAQHKMDDAVNYTLETFKVADIEKQNSLSEKNY